MHFEKDPDFEFYEKRLTNPTFITLEAAFITAFYKELLLVVTSCKNSSFLLIFFP